MKVTPGANLWLLIYCIDQCNLIQTKRATELQSTSWRFPQNNTTNFAAV